MTIRPAIAGDADAIGLVDAFATATLRETYQPNKAAIENRQRVARSLYCLVATVDEQVIGVVRYFTENESVRVIGLGVHPDFRLRGVARELLGCLAKMARKDGMTCLRLYTIKETGNVEIFHKMGFRVVAEHEDRLSVSDKYPTLTDVEMQLEILSE